MRALRALAACILVYGIAACGGDSNGPKRIEVEGSWSGTVVDDNGASDGLSLALTETNGSVTGNGTFIAGTTSVAVQASGTYAPPTVSLTISAPSFEPVNLTASVDESKMAGTINGSGFLNAAVNLQRQ